MVHSDRAAYPLAKNHFIYSTLCFDFRTFKVNYKVCNVSLYRRRIFILGPSHHLRLAGCALPSATIYQTPLYDLHIDQQGTDYIVQNMENNPDNPFSKM